MPRATHKDKRFVTELSSKRLSDLAAGASLAARTSYSLDELIAKVTIERVQFSGVLHTQAVDALVKRSCYRLAISRGYYSMYHAIRAVVFYVTRGDENQEHSTLPKHIPADFPGGVSWETKLKNARLERNRADYDPYPQQDRAFEVMARQIVGESAWPCSAPVDTF